MVEVAAEPAPEAYTLVDDLLGLRLRDVMTPAISNKVPTAMKLEPRAVWLSPLHRLRKPASGSLIGADR